VDLLEWLSQVILVSFPGSLGEVIINIILFLRGVNLQMWDKNNNKNQKNKHYFINLKYNMTYPVTF